MPAFAVLLYAWPSLAAWELLRLTKPSRHVWPLVFSNGLLVALNREFFVVMNKDKWNSLPKDIQKTLLDLRKDYIMYFGQKLMDDEMKCLARWESPTSLRTKAT